MKKQLHKILGLMMVGLLAAQDVLAQITPPSNVGGLPDWSTNANGQAAGIPGLVGRIINVILLITGIVSVLFIIIGGFQYILSGANEDLAKRGKTAIKNAVIGLIIVILSYTVIRVIYTTLIGR